MKRIVSMLLCLVMVLGLGSAALMEGLYTPGTYEGTGQGFGGAIQVNVEVDAQAILSVTVGDHSETAGIADPAMERIPQQILDTQSIAVDAVSGATYTSNGLVEAVKAALLAAGASEEEIMKPKGATEAAGEQETALYEADVVIVGAGGAGMTAAVEATAAGASVIVLDKMAAVGGNTIRAGSAMNVADAESQGKQTMAKSEMDTVESFLALEPKDELMKGWQDTVREEFEAYKASGASYLFDSPAFHKLQTYVDGDYVANPELIDTFGDKSQEAFAWLTELGTEWMDAVNSAIGATWRRSHTPTQKYGSKGSGFVLPQYEKAVENGAQVMTDMYVEAILMVDGRAAGVKGYNTLSKQPFEVKANKGVIIATGGFSANVEMREHYNKQWATLDASVPTTNGPQATGDGIVMAEAIGANLVGMEWIQLVPTIGPGMISTYIENMMVLDAQGNRIVKEDGRRDELSRAYLEHGKAGGVVTALWDSNTVVDGKTVVGTDVEARVAEGTVMKADSLEEMAKLLNLDYATLQATVDTFNASVDGAADPFGRTVFDQRFDKAPYYAGDINPSIHHTMGGIEINAQAEVLDVNGQVIPGLFAAGEVTGGIHGGNRLGGNAITDIIVFGRIAGQSAAK